MYGRPYCLPIFSSLTSAQAGVAKAASNAVESADLNKPILQPSKSPVCSRNRRHLLGVECKPGALADLIDVEWRRRDAQARGAFGQGHHIVPELAQIGALGDSYGDLRLNAVRPGTRQTQALWAHREGDRTGRRC